MNFIEIGAIVKPHGLKGELVLFTEDLYAGVILDFTSLYLDQFSSKVPYRIKEVSRLSNGTFKVGLQGVSSIEAANALRKVKVYQEESKLPKSQTIRWEGYTIQSINGEVIGAVEEVIENNMQLILVVVTETGYEHMIPLVEDFIVDFDEKNQTLKLDLPDGLLDL
ncbi:ribosome maturation factor RimM [Salibacteraceae bacterium]|jgi:16S rRNA processing protein RimM|nr:ribosome maturation factor RimM [Salibacteraceae bacterium]MDB4105830.1 ribosome maturation factor RimM [Salibacteraceae bacterium]